MKSVDYRTKEEERNKKQLQTTPKNQQNGNKNIYINNYVKCMWAKCFNQKTKNS